MVFLNPGQSESLTVWNEELLPSWRNACVTAGLGEPNAHGLHIQNAESASGYLSTWSVGLELTKAFSKKGRLGSRPKRGHPLKFYVFPGEYKNGYPRISRFRTWNLRTLY
jgi:hypothetical protein